jgi:poly(A) polymerase
MSNITRLAEAFKATGKELYLVGGTVRDELLGRPSNDIDCATDARPDEIQKIAATTNPLHIIPIGEKFGTIQIQYMTQETYPDLLVIEVTTYRGERYSPGSRKPEVQFGDSLLEDLRRRDFTINAIAKNVLTGGIVDPFNGQEDIKHGLIRAVEDAKQRFTDDPLRMLRAVRLATQLKFLIQGSTRMIIPEQVGWLHTISQERIRDELTKILLTTELIYGLEELLELGLFAIFLPEMVVLEGIEQQPHHSCDVFDHTTLVVQRTSSHLTVRLAALLHDIAKPQTRTVDEQGVTHFYEHEDIGSEMTRTILRRLRFGNDIVEHVAKVVKLHMRVNAYSPKWSNGAVRRLYIDAGDTLPDLLDLAIADGTSDRNEPASLVHARIEHLRDRLLQVHTEAEIQPLASPLDGNELMELFGRGPGAWLKPVKQHLHDLVIEGTLQTGDKEGARSYAREFLMSKNPT